MNTMPTISSEPKPQFGQWLLEQVNGGQYEGLHMTGADTFRIPWKHNSRKDCSDKDNRIFREWAVVSGKIKDYPNDKAKWKTNFRCALHSLKQFEKLEDRSKDEEDPHKIYRIVGQQNLENQIHTDVYISAADQLEAMKHEDLLRHLDTLHLSQQTEIPPWPVYLPQGLADQNNYCTTSLSTGHQPCLQSNVLLSAPEQIHEHYTTVYPSQLENLPSPYELEISIYYRRTKVLKQRCLAPCVQLHYQCDMSELRGESIPFPSTAGLVDHKQIQYTKCILDSIRRGLLLDVNSFGIHGLRQDKCNVFISTSDPAQIQEPELRKLPQDCKQLLFSFDKYLKDLWDFKENRCGSPNYTIYLCFGEKFPDGKPLEKKLILVKIVPLICQELYKRAQMEGASSLGSDISLQISHNSLFDLIEATYCLPTAD
ncbi:interferon regulatory factor 7 [Brachyhypopomus gauderio]|uniref:interferon regulatory factor 7 n=1 Tax=Brachyhypopomus gauderio TaxID=698409 RepID=UPI00404134FE